LIGAFISDSLVLRVEGSAMMGPRQVAQGALFYEFSIEGFVPIDHPVRGIDRFLDLTDVRPLLAPCYSANGRPLIDPELMICMMVLGYCQGFRSERRLCEEVHVNLAYRWFCKLDLADLVPVLSTFSKNRPSRQIAMQSPAGQCMAVSARVVFSGICSRSFCSVAWMRGWLVAIALVSMPT